MKNEKYTCVICKKSKTGFGNNPDPVKRTGICCDDCNATKVIPARLSGYIINKGKTLTAKEVKPKTVVFRGSYNGLELMVRRGIAWCAYIGVPLEYKLSQKYDDLNIDCHGGLTFGDKGKKEEDWGEGYFWYGWDYGHFSDYVHFGVELEGKKFNKKSKEYKEATAMFNKMNRRHKVSGDKDWKLSEVVTELFSVAEQFSKIIKERSRK